MIEAVNALHRFVGASSWRGYILDAFGESGNTTRPEDIMSYIQKWILPIRHPTGTARISKLSEEEGVVGPDLLVKNAQGLRVVDASIIVSINNRIIAKSAFSGEEIITRNEMKIRILSLYICNVYTIQQEE